MLSRKLKEHAESGTDGPRFEMSVCSTDLDSNGVLLFYFPQPLDTPRVCRSSLRLLAHPNDMVSSVVTIEVPLDRISNELMVFYYEYEPDDMFPDDVSALQRQAVGVVSEMGDLCATATVEMYYTGHKKGSAHHTIHLVNKGLAWDTCPHPVVKKQGLLPQMISKILARPLNKNPSYRNPMERDRAVLSTYIRKRQQWLDEQKQDTSLIGSWNVVCEGFRCDNLPLWAFFMEYANPVIREVDATRQSLARIVYMASTLQDLRTLGANDDTPALQQILADTLTFIPLASVYMTDKYRRVTKKRRNPYIRSLPVKHQYTSEDQWAHPLAFPKPGDLAYDCEDGTSTAYYVLRLLQKLHETKTNTESLLTKVQRLARRYTGVVAIGALKVGPTDYSYHCFMLLVDSRALNQKLQSYVDGAVVDVDESCTGPILPTLLVETTECITCTPDFKEGFDAKTFKSTRIADPVLHCKSPSSCFDFDEQYPFVVELILPQCGNVCGVQTVYCMNTTDNSLGVPMSTLRDFGSTDWSVVESVLATTEVHQAAGNIMCTMPRTHGLPPVSGDALKVPRPRISRSNGDVVFFCGSQYGKAVYPEVLDMAKRASYHCEIYLDVPVLHGINITIFVLYKGAAERTSLAVGCRDKVESRRRQDVLDKYPVRGVKKYSREVIAARRKNQCGTIRHPEAVPY